jgi:hypothetical protein
MLRRPCEFHPTPREEGCSSTAFGLFPANLPSCWNNLTDLGYDGKFAGNKPAVP